MNISKIQVKVGLVEFAGEGEEEWLAKQLDKILEKVPELLKIEVASTDGHEASYNAKPKNSRPAAGLSILNIVGRLKAKAGSEIVYASAAYLHFVEKKSSFTREEIIATMKSATGVFKDNHVSNLTKTLSQLERSGTFLKNGNAYTLNATKVSELDAILSQ